MGEYSREDLATELKEESKKAWSDAVFDIAKEFAYAVDERKKADEEYVDHGKEQVRKLMALAAYRISDQLIYCMSVQE